MYIFYVGFMIFKKWRDIVSGHPDWGSSIAAVCFLQKQQIGLVHRIVATARNGKLHI